MDPPLSDARIDARQLCLTAFRDAIILPRYEKLTLSLSEEMSRANDKDGDRGENWQWARIQQMLVSFNRFEDVSTHLIIQGCWFWARVRGRRTGTFHLAGNKRRISF